MLEADKTVAVIVDIQGKLARLVHDSEAMIEAARRLVRGAAALKLPIVWTEQNPDGLGPTVPELAELMDGEAIPKISFSCCGEPAFVSRLAAIGRKQVLLAGIESHICVYQTAVGLATMGCEVHLVADAIASRTPRNRRIGLWRGKDAGAQITSVEMALFELLGAAEGPAFKQILRIVK
jgi:nicotinamidase-related amidase